MAKSKEYRKNLIERGNATAQKAPVLLRGDRGEMLFIFPNVIVGKLCVFCLFVRLPDYFIFLTVHGIVTMTGHQWRLAEH